MMVFANRDAVRVNPRFAEMIIPVEWRDEYKSKLKTRETLQIDQPSCSPKGKATMLFPSGRIAYWANGRLNERPWKTSAVGLARKYNLPILPVHVTARNSGLFYWFAKWSTELRDMTVFHELFNKRGDRFDFVIGNLIPVEHLDGDINDGHQGAREPYAVYDLDANGDARFQPVVQPVAQEPVGAHSFR
jgi:putative hemolysin